MSFIAAAAIGAGGALIGGVLSSSAAGAQAGAAQNATAAQQAMFNQIMGNLAPYQQAGGGALNALEYGLGISPTYAPAGAPSATQPTAPIGAGTGGPVTNQFGATVAPGTYTDPFNNTYPGVSPGSYGFTGAAPTSMMAARPTTGTGTAAPWPSAAAAPGGAPGSGPGSFGWLTHPFSATDLASQLAPNYQFELGQGLGATQNAAAAAGGALSGNELQGLNTFAQNYAQGAYQQAFENYTTNQQNIYGRLGNLAQLGETASTGSASGAPLFASGISQTIQGVGAANAAGKIGVANALTGGLNNVAGYYTLGNLLGGGGSAGGSSSGFLPGDLLPSGVA